MVGGCSWEPWGAGAGGSLLGQFLLFVHATSWAESVPWDTLLEDTVGVEIVFIV